MISSENETQILETTWDAIIVGTGIGGATAGYSLSEKGRRVLFIERGQSYQNPQMKNRDGLWPEAVFDILNKKSFHPFLGQTVGGSSRLYGMVLEKPFESDFEGSMGQWPENLSAWQKYLQKAQEILNAQTLQVPEGYSQFFKLTKQKGLNPRPLVLAAKKLSTCEFCQNRFCAKDCKVDAFSGPLQAALKNPQNQQLTNCRVIRIDHTKNQATGVVVDLNGQQKIIKGKSIYLAGGALRTPSILHQSKSDFYPNGLGSFSGQLGRNLMRHLLDLYALDWPDLKNFNQDQLSHLAAVKCFGFSDFYVHEKIKLGVLQSFGAMPSFDLVFAELSEQVPLLKYLPGSKLLLEKIVQMMFRKPLMASIVEDEPQVENGLDLNSLDMVKLKYKISDRDKEKVNKMRYLVVKTFHPLVTKTFKQAESNQRLAHACGTCRMGSKIENSVVDQQGRVHELENLFIVDGSVFPTSLGINPSLMIAANAIRTVEKTEASFG